VFWVVNFYAHKREERGKRFAEDLIEETDYEETVF
jgi:hypothetical protein